MRLTAKIKLLPAPEQVDALKRTLETANAACEYISECAWQEKTFRQFRLHTLVYYDVRERFGLSAQMTVRSISKVADAYKLDRKRKHSFRQQGAIAYDCRILRWKLDRQEVSIWTVDGRQIIPLRSRGTPTRVAANPERRERFGPDRWSILSAGNL